LGKGAFYVRLFALRYSRVVGGSITEPRSHAEIAAKVTEVLADLILMAPPDDQAKLMADVLANFGSFVLEKKEDVDPTNPRRSRH
jgi:hypothetical protein